MESAFWDSSALVPLCVQQRSSLAVRRMIANYPIVVWWSTSLEMRSAFARLQRMKQLSPDQHAAAGRRLEQLRETWREMQPTQSIRRQAESLVDRFPLKAADSLQLAAALAWCSGSASGRVFISGDRQLLDAAAQLGFRAIEA